MSTDRLSLRAALALLLAGSAIVFLVGIQLERGAPVAAPPAAVAPSAQPASAPPTEAAGGEAGEAGHSAEATAAAQPTAAAGEGTGETAAEHAAETWPLGIDLEAPFLVGGVVLVSLILAVAVVVTSSRPVPLVIVGFALVFGLFDVLEVVHQVGQGRSGLAAIALVVLVAHAAAGLIALRLLLNRGPAMSAAA